jgi:hypothetical protein
MEPTHRRSWQIAIVALGICFAASTALWAGGSGFDDEHEHSEDEGPVFFGFVKDTRGAAVADAKVAVSTPSSELITRSNILGAYRVPGFRKHIDPETVKIVCEKDGYKYVRTFRRSSPSTNPTQPIEMECILQRG